MLFSTVLALGACANDPAEPSGPPPGSQEVGDTGVFIPNGKPATLPTPTSSATAPIIKSSRIEAGKGDQVTLVLEVEATAEIGFVYLDFGDDGVYRVAPEQKSTGSEKPITACGEAARSQGVTCTAACLSACSCLSCGDSDVEHAAEQGCALTCSLWAENGLLEDEPYYGSEKAFAELLYEGDAEYEIEGLASPLGCQTNRCGPPAATTTTRHMLPPLQIPLWTVPYAPPMFAPQVQTAEPVPQVSEPGGAATLRLGNCPRNAQC